MKRIGTQLVVLGLVSFHQAGYAVSKPQPGKPTALLVGDNLVIETCYNIQPDAEFKPGMSLKIGKYETSGFLMKDKDKPRCYSLKADVVGKGVSPGDLVTVKIDGAELKTWVASSPSKVPMPPKQNPSPKPSSPENQSSTQDSNSNITKVETLGQEYARYRLQDVKEAALGLDVFLDQIQELSLRVKENPQYEASFRQKLAHFEAQADQDGKIDGVNKAKEEVALAASQLVRSKAESGEVISRQLILEMMAQQISQYRGEFKANQSKPFSSFLEENWRVSSVQKLASQIRGLSKENQTFISQIDSRLVKFAVKNVRDNMASQIADSLVSEVKRSVGTSSDLISNWLKDQGQAGFPNSKVHKEAASLVQYDYALREAFKAAFDKVVSEKRDQVIAEIKKSEKGNKSYDALAMAAGDIFNSFKEAWVTSEAKSLAYSTVYHLSSIEAYRFTVTNTFESEVAKVQEKLQNSSLLTAKGVRVLVGGKELSLQGENPIGVGDYLSMELIGAKNIGGKALNAQLKVQGGNVALRTSAEGSIQLAAHESANINLPSVAVISAGLNNSTTLNEVYRITLSADEVSLTLNVRIDWMETLKALSDSKTPLEIRQQVLGFIQSKLSKEWSRQAGGLSNWYKKAEENGGTSLVAMLGKYVASLSYEDRAQLQSMNFIGQIQMAYPLERPGILSMTRGEYDTVQNYISNMKQFLRAY